MKRDIRLQYSLGELKKSPRTDKNMQGMLCIGEVLKVHHKWHTADVKLIVHGDLLVGSPQTEGKYTCKILESYAGYSDEYSGAYGSLKNIQKGSLVVIGFIDNLKTKPIILGCIHDATKSRNLLPQEYPVVQDGDKYRTLKVSPTQDYSLWDGHGQFEYAHHSMSFIKGSYDSLDEEENNVDYENLTIKNDQGDTLGTDEKHFKPLNILAVIRSKFSDITNSLRFFVSGEQGVFRISKVVNGVTTKIELTKNGTIECSVTSYEHTTKTVTGLTQVSVETTGTVNITADRVSLDLKKPEKEGEDNA